MFTIQEAKKKFLEDTNGLFEPAEQSEIFARCMDHITNQDRLTWKLNPLQNIDQIMFQQLVNELIEGKPIQYCLGYEWFGDVKLKVNSNVLIPRPETYELVLWVESHLKHTHFNQRILDIGTGSGCIPIWLQKKYPTLFITALDISGLTLQVAEENAKNHNCSITFLCDDILNSIFEPENSFDIIISNPPYITIEEKHDMAQNVLQFEPHQALFVTNEDPLQFYKAICQFALKHLTLNGEIFLEINRDYAIEIKALFENVGFSATIRKDMYGNDRMLQASR